MRRNKGQSTLEYAVVIALVIAALVVMGWSWFRGAYQKKIMSAGDDISGGGQFDVQQSTVTSTSSRQSSSSETMTGTGTGASFSSTQDETATSDVSASTPGFGSRR